MDEPSAAAPVGFVSEEEIEAARKVFAGPCDFRKGVPKFDLLPESDLNEVAFAGRSNVGKSSLINALTNRRDLARASNTPGRTQELNYFDLGGHLHLVDLPGYGFAEAPKPKVDAWNRLIRAYLRGRSQLRRVLVLIDSRHGVKANDLEIFALLNESAVSFQIVLTKADKIPPPALAAVEAETRALLSKNAACHPWLIATSSSTGLGLPELRAAIFGLRGV